MMNKSKIENQMPEPKPNDAVKADGFPSSPSSTKPIVSSSYSWVSVDVELPEVEGYYAVKFRNGDEDEKPFRIRPSKNIRGFMTMEEVTHWAAL